MGRRTQAMCWVAEPATSPFLPYQAESHKVRRYRRHLTILRVATLKKKKKKPNPENNKYFEEVKKLELSSTVLW